ncbi:MAG: hypothetical protein ACXAC8_07355 [Candidatus Hodarchaeales archaeon]
MVVTDILLKISTNLAPNCALTGVKLVSTDLFLGATTFSVINPQNSVQH